MKGWIGVDLDGTLAKYEGWIDMSHIGEPVEIMVTRIRKWLGEGIPVKIFTARANDPQSIPYIEAWSDKVFGFKLPITATKDYGMIELWDDRAVQVEPNTGRRMDGLP